MPKQITVAESVAIIEDEIKWCNDNPAITFGFSEDYGKGFIKGLKQAIYLIKAFQAVTAEDRNYAHITGKVLYE
jgi:hypothetical protein